MGANYADEQREAKLQLKGEGLSMELNRATCGIISLLYRIQQVKRMTVRVGTLAVPGVFEVSAACLGILEQAEEASHGKLVVS